MKLYTQAVRHTINKAYLSTNAYKGDIAHFAAALRTFQESIKETDSEETLKDYINKFLYESHFKEKFKVKVDAHHIDLAILRGQTPTSPVGVLLEVKSLRNKAEMVQTDNLQAKGFYELVLYYLMERTERENTGITRLIISNAQEWFIFDAQDFERLFYANTGLREQFLQWKAGKLSGTTREWCYREIIAPFVKKTEEKLCAGYFSINEYATEEAAYQGLIPLYKALSPEHLLKLPFANDSNSLNYDFYNELLHIIGLHEVKQGTQKVMVRLPMGSRNDGSLLENTIYVLRREDVVRNLDTEVFKHLEPLNDEERHFAVALELGLTWLNRILFLKLLESQLIQYNNGDYAYAFLNTAKIQDFDILQELFFEVLALEPHGRRASIQKKYGHIPYLNSSLFDAGALEKATIKVNQLKHHIPLPLHAKTVLKDSRGLRLQGSKPLLSYIFEFLDSYDFSSDHTAQLQSRSKSIINPSVLGLVFEKINGYQEGSFFTPGYVTMYISRETIRQAVIKKFRESGLPGFGQIQDLTGLYNQLGNISIEKANAVFNSVKICDPAVGSGHFLVSALNELLALKSELGILAGRSGKLLRYTYCEVQNDELYITHHGELFAYDKSDKESQRVQETLFYEKQQLIEQSLFGVDINPNAVHICRLRLWIELLKSAFYTAKSGYTQLETLPNIDINIKTGNSLISRFALNGAGLSNGALQKIRLATQKYKDQVTIYKSTADKRTKQQAEAEIARLKKQFAGIVNPNDPDYKAYKQLESEIGQAPMLFTQEDKAVWEEKLARLVQERDTYKARYEEHLHAVYGNAFEWRYEFPEVIDENGSYKGFDVVMGNPPYLNVEQVQKAIKEHLKANSDVFYKRADLFALFIDLALEKLIPDGIMGFIVPSVVLNNLSYKPLREKILKNNYLDTACYVGGGVFREATVDTVILILSKYPKEKIKLINGLDFKNKKEETVHTGYFEKYNYSISIQSAPAANAIYDKAWAEGNLLLSDYFDVFQGIVTGNNPVYIFDSPEDAARHHIEKKLLKPVLHGRDFGKWAIKNTKRRILYVTDDSDIKKTPHTLKYLKKFQAELEKAKSVSEKSGAWYALHRPRNLKKLDTVPKIIVQNTRNERLRPRLVATVDELGMYGSQGLNFIVPKNASYPVYFLVGLLNSKLMDYIFATKFLNLAIKADYLKQIRFPGPSPAQLQKMETLVKNILQKKKQDAEAEIAGLEHEIDSLVYTLYDISQEEQDLIDAHKTGF